MKLLYLLTLLTLNYFLGSCAHVQKSPQSWKRETLFPYGTFVHIVNLQPNDTQKPPQRFKSLVSLSETKIQIVVLSPFNTSLIRITDDLKNPPVIEVFLDSLEQRRAQIEMYYLWLRTLLLSHPPKIYRQQKGPPYEALTWTLPDKEPGKILSLTIEQADDHGVPTRFKVVTESTHISVEVHYE